METDVTVLDDAEFERVARDWGYNLDEMSARRKEQGMEHPDIDSIGHMDGGVWWLIMRQRRWDEIEENKAKEKIKLRIKAAREASELRVHAMDGYSMRARRENWLMSEGGTTAELEAYAAASERIVEDRLERREMIKRAGTLGMVWDDEAQCEAYLHALDVTDRFGDILLPHCVLSPDEDAAAHTIVMEKWTAIIGAMSEREFEHCRETEQRIDEDRETLHTIFRTADARWDRNHPEKD